MATEATPIEQLWTARDVAKVLQLGRNAVYEMANNGQLPNIRLGSRIRFIPADVRAWIELQKAKDAPVVPIR